MNRELADPHKHDLFEIVVSENADGTHRVYVRVKQLVMLRAGDSFHFDVRIPELIEQLEKRIENP